MSETLLHLDSERRTRLAGAIKLCAASLIAVVVSLLAVLLITRDPLPTYLGRPVSDWFEGASLERPIGNPEANPFAAFTHFGAEAQPFLIRWAGRRPPAVTKFNEQCLANLPKWIRQYLPQFHSQEWYVERRQRALWLLAFVEDWESSRVIATRPRISDAGTNALPVLVEALVDTNAQTRFLAAVAVRRLGSRGSPAACQLVHATSDPDSRVAICAVLALGEMVQCASNVVPVLVELATNNTNKLRGVAIESLGRLGPTARAAMPDLTALAQSGLGRLGPTARAAMPDLTALARNSDRNQRSSASGSGTGASFGFLREIADRAVATAPPTMFVPPPLTEAARSHPTQRAPTFSLTVEEPPHLPRIVHTGGSFAPVSTALPVVAGNGDDRDIQMLAVDAISKIGSKQEAVKLLLPLLPSLSGSDQIRLAVALWRLDRENPALNARILDGLRATESSQRFHTVQRLKEAGANASPFLPDIQLLLEDPESLVRICATNALRQISSPP